MVNNEALSNAIADLRSQSTPNFAVTARKWNVDRNTLRRRFQGLQCSNNVAHFEAQGVLSTTMEDVLVERINTLSARGMPPTPQIVRNLVSELSGGPVGKNWVSRFVKRRDSELCSVWLDSIDYSRRIADNSKHFEHYFQLVSVNFESFLIIFLLFLS